jgi:PAS domain S-box-containing protein
MNTIPKHDLISPVQWNALLAILPLAAGLATASFGLLTLSAWLFDWPLLASFGAGPIPMAPSTALLFLLYGAAVCLRARGWSSRPARWLGVSMVGSGIVVAFTLLVLSWLGIQWPGELPGMPITGELAGGSPIGHMSRVTAFCFLLAGGSFLASLSPAITRWRSALALLAAVLILCGNPLCLPGYSAAAEPSPADQKPSGPLPGGRAAPSPRTPAPDFLLHSLTEEERAWLRDHPVIRVVQDPDWRPVEFADERGKPSGMAEDYLNLIEQRLGVTFERVQNLSWQEAYARLKNWEIDMTTSVTVTPERTKFWSFTKPYMELPNVIFADRDIAFIADMRELAGKTVAVVDGYAVSEWIPRDFPDIQLVKVKNVKEGLEKLQRQEVMAYVGDMLVGGYYLTRLNMTTLKIAGNTPYVNAQSMAVRKDWGILTGILQKALDSISETERNDIYRKWLPIRYEHGFNYPLFWRTLAVLAAIILGLAFWIWALAREIRRRKIAEVATIKSEQRFRAIATNTPDHILMQDRDLRYRFVVNPQLGLTEADMIGKTDGDILGKEDAENLTAIKRKVLETGEVFHLEVSLRNLKGEAEFFDGSYIPQFDSFGKAEGLIGYFRNITERKRVEEALKESEARFRVAQEMSPDGFTILHPVRNENGEIVDFTWVFENSSIARINGTDPQEIIGKRLIHLFPDHRDTPLFKAYLDVADTGKPRVIEEISLNDILSRSIWLRLVVVSMGTDIAILAQDITERKQVEEALAESNQRFAAAFHESPAILSITRISDGKYLDVNQAFLDTFEFSRDEVIGHTSTELGILDIEGRRQLVKDQIEAGGLKNAEIAARSKSGRKVYVLFSSKPLVLHDEQHHITTAIDVSERKKADLKAAEQFTELQRWHQAMMGREQRVLEIKREVNELLAQAGKPPRYPSVKPDASQALNSIQGGKP